MLQWNDTNQNLRLQSQASSYDHLITMNMIYRDPYISILQIFQNDQSLSAISPKVISDETPGRLFAVVLDIKHPMESFKEWYGRKEFYE